MCLAVRPAGCQRWMNSPGFAGALTTLPAFHLTVTLYNSRLETALAAILPQQITPGSFWVVKHRNGSISERHDTRRFVEHMIGETRTYSGAGRRPRVDSR